MEKKAQAESSMETFKFYDSSQINKMSKSKSKEKICNDQQKAKIISKLPRIIHMPTRYYKPIENSTKMNDDSGDSLPGPSKVKDVPIKMKKEDIIPKRLKISHIPRLRPHKEGPKDNSVPSTSNTCRPRNNYQYIPECRNVQRVNILINPEFCPDDRSPPLSVQSTRPIPTLGQIYGRISTIDSDPLDDWFMTLRAPMNSIRSSNARSLNSSVLYDFSTSCSSTVGSPAHCQQDEFEQISSIAVTRDNTRSGLKSTNENIGVWLSTDMAFLTKDNESGYQTVSLQNTQKLKTLTLKKSQESQAEEGMTVNTNQTYCVGLSIDAPMTSLPPKVDVECGTATKTCSLIREKSTVVLCHNPVVEEGTVTSKSYVSMKPSKTDAKNNTCSSNVNKTATTLVPRVTIPSYTDCLSEVLQKTTNFEVIEGIELPKSPSSAAVTDIEVRDNTIPGTRDATDEFCNGEDSIAADNCPTKQSKLSNITFLKSDATVTEWSCRYRSENSSDYPHQDSFNYKHELNKRYHDDSRHDDMRECCRKCQRFKRFPSTRYKLPRSFGSWRSGGSIRRLCCRRWNHVWKKTTERWAIWSTRSPAKNRRFRTMRSFVQSVLWEDVNVQTNVLVYNETGTDNAVKEQKSAAINTMFNMDTLQAISNLANSGSTQSNKFKHVNSGPSMFPFFRNTNGNPSSGITTDKNLSGYQFPQCQQNQCTSFRRSCTWNTYAAIDICKSAKSCQYEGETIEEVEATTSILGEVDVSLADQPTDTEDLPNFMADKVTSTFTPIPTTKKDACNLDTIQQNVIMCHNTEAEVKFPTFDANSSVTIPSGSDITYYRPVAGTDITHLISETRTQQALYPILRKYYSNAASASANTESDNYVTGIETQISPKESVETASMGMTTLNQPLSENATSYSTNNGAENQITQRESMEKASMGVTTSNPPLTDNTTSYSTNNGNLNSKKEYVECASQTEESKLIPAEETETTMTPMKSISVVSVGITPSLMGEKDEVFISECLLMTNDTKKENLAVQTQRTIPELAFSDAKIISISSQELSFNKIISRAEDRGLGSRELLRSCSRAIGSDVAVDVKAVSSNETICSKCCCNPNKDCVCNPCNVVSCGTNPTVAAFNLTRSTSARGLDSYYETEILLNNLIKKALIGSNVGSRHTNFLDKSDLPSRHDMIYLSTGTNTHVGLETKSIGQTTSDMGKLNSLDKMDAEIQYNEEIEKPVPTPHKSASIMTSYCGLAASIQVPATSALTVKSEVFDNGVSPGCTCGMGFDVVTNTNYKTGTVTEDLEQASIVHTTQKSLELNVFRNCSSKPVNSTCEVQKNVKSQLESLSRLLGKKKTNSSIDKQMANKWINEYPPVDTSPHQSKLLNSSESSKNAFESIMLSEEEDQKRRSCILTLKTGSHDHNPVPYELPAFVLSKDSLADVLPVKKTKDNTSKKSETILALNSSMVDQFTLDNYVSKDVKESMLQACPEICDTGTDSLSPTYSKKSACVLTTQCVLPPAPPCGSQMFKRRSPDCVFVYGEPRCVVHNGCADAAIQMNPAEVNLKGECVTQSVGQLTSYCSLRDGRQRNPSALIREVLSPKVYKALYETTKLVVSQDIKQPSSRHTLVAATRVDAEVDAAKFDRPILRSASVLTSDAAMGVQLRCRTKDRGTHAHHKRGMQEVKQSKESLGTCVNHEESSNECYEACMRRQLVTSCRYYSNLLTKQLGRVKNNLTKHLAPSMEKIKQQGTLTNYEACTMKPSGRNTFASQTLKHSPYYNPIRPMSCSLISPATSLTNICKYDRAHLKSVYYMLTAIEGRLRRLKLNSPSTYCQ